ncbi:PREDICTED: uncharacterized protein LOC104602551 isoform X2 [Nelumbo nucifera]|uniref:Uncharacterized protein LOC104602551 isoform X2 n=1 Tax=Nelumbo nucifera TaxID=4432 RepID=A0A1U8AG08_NELNU|nr:PREDICTED: uncharacterized protein LOC104602551 isoform X2 [Nelumbo nucifera]XP_019054311.1 PREDICTED: uncharacterized protein LOC104602551 isoform X2 [Nelumbo nucifera]
MALHNLALIIKSSSNDDEFLLARQTRPPKFGDEEYDSYTDSDLWDLPFAPLKPMEGESNTGVIIEGAESCSEKLNFRTFGVDSAIDQILSNVGFRRPIDGHWTFWKYFEEAEFGPGPPTNTVFILGKSSSEDKSSQELFNWMSIQSCVNLLVHVKPSNDRIGPLVVAGLLTDSDQSRKWKVPATLLTQEYPPGVKIIPMGSRTAKPFHTTNLVVIAPNNVSDGSGKTSFAAYGDALIMDPGCQSEFYAELRETITALPRKLVVFVTHHHRDHVEGLSIIQECNPDAILLAHENTMHRIKDDWSLGYTPISGGEVLCIGGERLKVIFAPGHTDGHMALLHVSTHSLILGDHCVGQGSAVLDFTSGGNMKDYFQTTYNFLDLSPHALIPMHGRVNVWPKYMLCGYLKNRRNRESSILKAIESGAETLFDIVAETYSDVNPRVWFAASSNVRLHVDHLASQDKLPKEFSLEKFNCSCVAFAAKVNSLVTK